MNSGGQKIYLYSNWPWVYNMSSRLMNPGNANRHIRNTKDWIEITQGLKLKPNEEVERSQILSIRKNDHQLAEITQSQPSGITILFA